ncbi:unnamed protein product [Rotaria magnacalcarata]|uniref:G-protein coupled receptors family 1 profile domain-containing protein n=1 Tax=Rotaria magnacalcarata TaxID=392030 RepID=A0A816SSP0_9BILA|nr:unnamed protein product [Rotaria magnacalcarata]CAF4002379.1 unnamed protein product [Rotaria magnacalcarata]
MHVLFQLPSSVSLTTLNNSNDNLTLSILQNVNINASSRPFMGTILVAFCLSIIIALTILGNILVLIALCVDFALRSPTHLLMGNLACADLLLGITVLPFSASLEILDGKWVFGRTFCHIWLAIDVLYCTASIYGLMFISIERYVGVTRPLRYPIIITHRRTLLTIIVAWLVAIVVSVVPFLGWNKQVKSTDQICLVNDNLSYVLFSCSFSFYIPLIIILCVYGRIYAEAVKQYRFLSGGEKTVRVKETDGQECVTLRIHIPHHLTASTTLLSNGIGSNTQLVPNGKRASTQMTPTVLNKLSKFKRERKAAKTLGIVVGMFTLCWSPFFLLLPIKAWTNYDPGIIFSICFWLGYCNSCFNPFIYAFSSREFRKAFGSILKCQRRQYKPSASFCRISASQIDQSRLGKSHSCDITAGHILAKSEAIINQRISYDSQRPFTNLKKHQNFLDRPQLLPFRSLANPTTSQSLTTFDDTNPWQLRQSN